MYVKYDPLRATTKFSYLPDLKNSFSEENDVFAMPLSWKMMEGENKRRHKK